jgi:hypothetical protein
VLQTENVLENSSENVNEGKLHRVKDINMLWARGMVQVVEHLSNKHKASSNIYNAYMYTYVVTFCCTSRKKFKKSM